VAKAGQRMGGGAWGKRYAFEWNRRAVGRVDGASWGKGKERENAANMWGRRQIAVANEPKPGSNGTIGGNKLARG